MANKGSADADQPDEGRLSDWRETRIADIVVYRLLNLACAAVQSIGEQADIAEQIGRNSDLLVHLSDQGFGGLIPQAILEPRAGDKLFIGRLENQRHNFLVFCRARGFEAAVQLSLTEDHRDLASARVIYFDGEESVAGAWASEVAGRIERGELGEAAEAAGHEPAHEADAEPREHISIHWEMGGAPPSERNRHRYKRSSVFCSGKILFDGSTLSCDILNLSASGAQIRITRGDEPPDRFMLKIERFGEFGCEVVRRAGDKLGVAFVEPPETVEKIVEDIINNPDQTNEIRAHARRLVLLSGAVYVENRPIQCRVLDISAGGARIRVDHSFDHDNRLALMIYRFGEFPVEVAWEKDVDLGIMFIDDPNEIERIIGHILPKRTASVRRH
jgi:hypothetical protein